MKRKLSSILLVDDNLADNYYHKVIIQDCGITDNIEIAENGAEAIEFLKSHIDGKHPQPDLVFLDINMPLMDGWEFLEEYKNLKTNQKCHCIIVMLSNTINKDDKIRAKQNLYVDDFSQKPLTPELINAIVSEHFSDN